MFFAGGPLGALTALITDLAGAKASPTTHETEGQQRRAIILNGGCTRSPAHLLA